jgi:transcriptional regulator with XRE-family HTH domain
MKKINQSQIAKELGISKSYLSMILSGQRQVSQEMWDKLSSLGVHKFVPTARLGSRHSTTELLPHSYQLSIISKYISRAP